MGPKKGLLDFATASMLKHNALFLSSYEYDLQYLTSEPNANASGLSRFKVNVKHFNPQSK